MRESHAQRTGTTEPRITRHGRPRRLAERAVAFAWVIAAGLVGACSDGGEAAGRRDEETGNGAAGTRVRVVATTGMIGDIAERIGGERTDVVTLMGPGVDPHLYKPTPGDVRAMSGARVLLYNGLHLEGRMQEAIEALSGAGETDESGNGRSGGTLVARVTEGIPEDLLRSPPEFEGQHDPHVWFDVSMWSLAAQSVCDALVRADPAGRGEYEDRTRELRAELDALHAWVRERIASVPRERRVLVTAHDAFGYFGRAYDIEVRGIQGISTDSEASIRDINALVDMLVERRVSAVFVESSVPRKTVEALVQGCASRGHAIGIGGELFSDAMGPRGTPEGTYTGMIRHNVGVIARALGGTPDNAAPAHQTASTPENDRAGAIEPK